MKKSYRIKKNEEFQQVFKKGKSVANRQFVVYVLDKPDQLHFRVGLSVGKKIGNAVVRNRVKRLLRQTIFELSPLLQQPKDYIIIARHPAATMDYVEVKKSLQHVLTKAKVLNKVHK
ncbi:ribonuclease P protein component [Metabacillus iocasae]|uniref:Ribonuclease P protein component n=1 Tax=Priestia iocasae TaxID=2291674 RepID=A0ABS2QZQ8_9BACI|nr:ribonuclease P protein component [Metabacillus iocasae]MBM7704221.1 ribonuclease P protein component [Metabacillus iocasae]